jgi:hypothetical protein
MSDPLASNKLSPVVKSTETSPDLREWLPTTFENVLREVDYLLEMCAGSEQVPLLRGHVQYDWLLDCKLVRTMLPVLYGSDPPYPRRIAFHTNVTDVLLEKFERRCRPSAEATAKEITDGIDPLYELMKYYQQYDEKDLAPHGTFLMDWTLDRDIALYFSTYEGKGSARRVRTLPGALWIFYPMATGNVLMRKKLSEIVDMMKNADFRLKAQRTLSLIFHPPRQTAMRRAMAQKPVYVAQMDFRYDLADIWTGTENERRCCVFRKIILSESVVPDAVKHLEKVSIDESRVYPD